MLRLTALRDSRLGFGACSALERPISSVQRVVRELPPSGRLGDFSFRQADSGSRSALLRLFACSSRHSRLTARPLLDRAET